MVDGFEVVPEVGTRVVSGLNSLLSSVSVSDSRHCQSPYASLIIFLPLVTRVICIAIRFTYNMDNRVSLRSPIPSASSSLSSILMSVHVTADQVKSFPPSELRHKVIGRLSFRYRLFPFTVAHVLSCKRCPVHSASPLPSPAYPSPFPSLPSSPHMCRGSCHCLLTFPNPAPDTAVCCTRGSRRVPLTPAPVL